MNCYSASRLNSHYYHWHIFVRILHTMNRRTELKRLIRWAKYKKLEGPLKLYLTRMIEEEEKLLRYRFRHPGIARCARFAHGFGNLISPEPRYRPRGSASHYKYSKSSRRRNALWVSTVKNTNRPGLVLEAPAQGLPTTLITPAM